MSEEFQASSLEDQSTVGWCKLCHFCPWDSTPVSALPFQWYPHESSYCVERWYPWCWDFDGFCLFYIFYCPLPWLYNPFQRAVAPWLWLWDSNKCSTHCLFFHVRKNPQNLKIIANCGCHIIIFSYFLYVRLLHKMKPAHHDCKSEPTPVLFWAQRLALEPGPKLLKHFGVISTTRFWHISTRKESSEHQSSVY